MSAFLPTPGLLPTAKPSAAGPSRVSSRSASRKCRIQAVRKPLPPPSPARWEAFLPVVAGGAALVGVVGAVAFFAGMRTARSSSDATSRKVLQSGTSANNQLKLPEESQQVITQVMNKLMQGKNLTETETVSVLDALLLSPSETEFQSAALLTLLQAKGVTAEELAGMARAMRKKATLVAPKVAEPMVDIVGTGGDGANTVNISTAAAVLAAASGARVAKHGNRSSTSMCGSADVLESFGVNINLSAAGVAKCVEEVGIGFMFAPVFHPAMKNMKEVRRGLKFRTAFNILGPLLNPAMAQRQVIGVYSEDIIDKMAEAVYALGTEKTWVVHCSGLDELSPLGKAVIREVTPAGISKFEIDPAVYSIPACTLDDLQGGDAEYNSTTLRSVLGGSPGPISNAIILNAAAALVVADVENNFADAVARATRTLISGKALEMLNHWSTLSKRLK